MAPIPMGILPRCVAYDWANSNGYDRRRSLGNSLYRTGNDIPKVVDDMSIEDRVTELWNNWISQAALEANISFEEMQRRLIEGEALLQIKVIINPKEGITNG